MTDHEGTMTSSSSDSSDSDMGHYNDNNHNNHNSNTNSSSNNGNDAMDKEEEEEGGGGTGNNMRGMEMERLAEGGLFQSIPIPLTTTTTTANHHLQPKEKTSKEANKIDSNKINHEGKDNNNHNEINPDRRRMIFQDGQWINPDTL